MEKEMSDFVVMCTQEQGKLAYELGAPIKKVVIYHDYCEPWGTEDTWEEETDDVHVPTQEQMIGWLRTLGYMFNSMDCFNGTINEVRHNTLPWSEPILSTDDGLDKVIDAALNHLKSCTIK